MDNFLEQFKINVIPYAGIVLSGMACLIAVLFLILVIVTRKNKPAKWALILLLIFWAICIVGMLMIIYLQPPAEVIKL